MLYQLGIGVQKSFLLFVIGGVSNVVIFAIQPILLHKKIVNDRQLAIASMVLFMLGALVLCDWQSFGYDKCEQWSFNKHSSVNETILTSACVANGCVWNQQGLYGDCATCAPICHSPKYTLDLFQLYIGFSMINVAFPPGRVCTAAIYSHLLKKRKRVSCRQCSCAVVVFHV